MSKRKTTPPAPEPAPPAERYSNDPAAPNFRPATAVSGPSSRLRTRIAKLLGTRR